MRNVLRVLSSTNSRIRLRCDCDTKLVTYDNRRALVEAIVPLRVEEASRLCGVVDAAVARIREVELPVREARLNGRVEHMVVGMPKKLKGSNALA